MPPNERSFALFAAQDDTCSVERQVVGFALVKDIARPSCAAATPG
jgi:hypothetical protein